MPSSDPANVTSTNEPPFYLDPAVGDLVIRSSDDIDFHVHKDILTRASQSFSTMLASPRAASAVVCGKPLIQVQEDSAVWAYLVPVLYIPRPPEPALDASQLDLIRAILDAARKYDVPSWTECMRSILKSRAVVAVKPVNVYAVACAYELEDVARIAARCSLSEPMGIDYVQELDLISTRTFHKLSAYRTQCVAAALRETDAWYHNRRDSLELGGCSRSGPCTTVARGRRFIRWSWATYMDKLERSLEQTPDAAKARSPSLLEPVIQSAQDCLKCLNAIHANVEKDSSSLERALKEAIDKVSLEF